MLKIVKIGAIWCPGCLVMKKIWKNIIKDYPNIVIEELDYDMNDVSKYNPGKVLPVVIFISKKGEELERLVGEQKENTLREKIEKYVKEN